MRNTNHLPVTQEEEFPGNKTDLRGWGDLSAWRWIMAGAGLLGSCSLTHLFSAVRLRKLAFSAP